MYAIKVIVLRGQQEFNKFFFMVSFAAINDLKLMSLFTSTRI